MSQALTVELNDQVFETIRKQAEAAGISPAQVVVAALEQRFNGNHKRVDARSEAQKQAARERFESHFGTVDLGHPIGTDNEAIDADLGREYGDPHEAS
jgi:predicted transcriptional regulator